MGSETLPSTMGSEALPSTYYILSDESRIIPFNLYILSDESSITYFPTNPVYPFSLGVTGIKIFVYKVIAKNIS